jgi:Abortive infection alpha
MIFGREREAVRNATRVIRDLVLRTGREGSGGIGGGLGAMAMLAIGPLRQLPEIATRVPGTLRDLGERVTAIPGARRRAPALAFAAQALAGSVRYGSTLRERYLNLLAAAMDGGTAARVHPAFLTVLRQLTPDEVRIVSTFQHDGPYPLVTIGVRYRFGERLSTELRHFSLLGTQASCEHPERTAMYVDNLCRLGLTELRSVRIADDTRIFRALEAHPEVQAAIARIEARIPELESAHPNGGDGNRVVADVQRTALYVTAFGRQFYEACEYRPEHAR